MSVNQIHVLEFLESREGWKKETINGNVFDAKVSKGFSGGDIEGAREQSKVVVKGKALLHIRR